MNNNWSQSLLCDDLALYRDKLATGLQSNKREVLKVLITGASNLVSYLLIRELAKGHVFGNNRELSLVLMDDEPLMNTVKGLAMELKDCMLPLVKDIVLTTNKQVAFTDIDLAIFGSSDQQSSSDDCKSNDMSDNMSDGLQTRTLSALLFIEYARALNSYAKNTVKVFVVAEPTYINAYILTKYCKVVQHQNVVTFSRLYLNKFIANIWKTRGIKSNNLRNIFLWGFNNANLLPDVSLASVRVLQTWQPWPKVVENSHFVKNSLTMMARDDEKRMDKSMAISTTKAICDQLRDWWQGTSPGDVMSMCVASDGSYAIPSGIFWNFPVTIEDRVIRIHRNMELDIMTNDFMEEEKRKCLREMNKLFAEPAFGDESQNLSIAFAECM